MGIISVVQQGIPHRIRVGKTPGVDPHRPARHLDFRQDGAATPTTELEYSQLAEDESLLQELEDDTQWTKVSPKGGRRKTAKGESGKKAAAPLPPILLTKEKGLNGLKKLTRKGGNRYRILAREEAADGEGTTSNASEDEEGPDASPGSKKALLAETAAESPTPASMKATPLGGQLKGPEPPDRPVSTSATLTVTTPDHTKKHHERKEVVLQDHPPSRSASLKKEAGKNKENLH